MTWPTPAPGRWQCTRVLGCIYNDTLGCLAYPSCPPDDPEDAADDADYPDDLFATVPKWWPENVDVKDELL